ncbi:hypothetical protein NEISICOT_01641 [Neisseria sicca ATCC 29256]|uniref:Uncharacterized protein n=1 Tax=Neisseria sicca ATCC 29256 TaxID=547045 RepID=C6M541_NEISI|nr:hypothetical protein NEISICOT_01641 [Neisseria sicca ATCC 29256]
MTATNNICFIGLFLIFEHQSYSYFTLLPKQPSQNQTDCSHFIVYGHTIKFQTTPSPSGVV